VNGITVNGKGGFEVLNDLNANRAGHALDLQVERSVSSITSKLPSHPVSTSLSFAPKAATNVLEAVNINQATKGLTKGEVPAVKAGSKVVSTAATNSTPKVGSKPISTTTTKPMSKAVVNRVPTTALKPAVKTVPTNASLLEPASVNRVLEAPQMVKHHVFNKFRGNSAQSQKYQQFPLNKKTEYNQ
jgi:hypothetical protein